MRKILAVLFLSFFLFSCSNDESNDNSNNQSDFYGKWALYKEVHNGNDVYEDYVLDEDDPQSFIETISFTDDFGPDEEGYYIATWHDMEMTSDIFKYKSIGNSQFKVEDSYFTYPAEDEIITLTNENKFTLEYSTNSSTTIQYYQKVEDY